MNSEGVCKNIQYCNRIDPAKNPNYDCSAIDSSVCTNGDEDGICQCISGFNPNRLVNGNYDEMESDLTFENSVTDIVCANPFPCTSGLRS
jgi:hypothetical protein